MFVTGSTNPQPFITAHCQILNSQNFTCLLFVTCISIPLTFHIDLHHSNPASGISLIHNARYISAMLSRNAISEPSPITNGYFEDRLVSLSPVSLHIQNSGQYPDNEPQVTIETRPHNSCIRVAPSRPNRIYFPYRATQLTINEVYQ